MDGSQILAGEGVETSAPAFTLPRPLLEVVAAKHPRGTWFDPGLNLNGTEGDTFANEVLGLIASIETRERRRRPKDDLSHHKVVRAVLANGLRCRFFRDPPAVAYFRGAGRSRKLPGWPAWLSDEAVGKTVDLLTVAGLVTAVTGKDGVACSTYAVTDDLYGLAGHCRISFGSLLLKLPLGRLVRLREGNSDTHQVRLPYAREVFRWTSRLALLNAFLAQQDIRLPLSAGEAAEWVRHWNKERRKGDPLLIRPELFQTDLYRQFNNGSIEQGGRMYGGWWIETPKTLRPKILINGQSTTELDFSGCAIRMLYHERGLDCIGDPYSLAQVENIQTRLNRPPRYFRGAVKQITQALINDRDGKAPEAIALDGGVSFRPHFKRREIRTMIEAKHEAISDAFGTGAGLRLQRREADLMLKIVLSLKDRGVVALPIHDAIRVPSQHEALCRSMMINLYREEFGFEAILD
jgi:hypothetical protein